MNQWTQVKQLNIHKHIYELLKAHDLDVSCCLNQLLSAPCKHSFIFLRCIILIAITVEEKKKRTGIREWACTVIHSCIQIPLIPMALRHLDANFRTGARFIKVLKARSRTHNHFENPSRSLIFIISHLTASLLLAQFSAVSKGYAEAHNVSKSSSAQPQLAQPCFSALSLVSVTIELDKVEKTYIRQQ